MTPAGGNPRTIVLHFEGGGRAPASYAPAPGVVRSVGRDAGCDLVLADRSVSRRHAELRSGGERWEIRNLGQGGTLLNGRAAEGDAWVVLAHGAMIAIGPYLLRVDLGDSLSTPGTAAPFGATIGFAEAAAGRVAAVPAAALESLAELRLSALTDVATRLARSDDADAVERATVDALVAAGDFVRATIAERRIADGAASWSVRASAAAAGVDPAKPVSRTLLGAALDAGAMVRLEDDARFAAAESVMAAGTTDALAVPIGPAGSGCVLVVDTSERAARRASAAPFVNVVARLATLALESVARRRLTAELADAHRAQERLLPGTSGARGCVRWSMSTRPGWQVSGDLFAVLERPDGGAVVLLGDVAGKGAPAGLVMASTLAFTEAAVLEGAPIERVMQRVGTHIARGGGSLDAAVGAFVTVFAIEIQPDGACRAIDAGHSLAAVVHGGVAELLAPEGGGPPLGVVPDFPYESGAFRLSPGDRIVLFSDGVSEQPNRAGAMLGHEAPVAALRGSGGTQEDVDRLLAMLVQHAQGEAYADDVTVASIEFAPGA